MADETLTGCYDKDTGKVIFVQNGLLVKCYFSGCYVTDGVHEGQIQVTIENDRCDDVYYACLTNDTGSFAVTIPDNCCCYCGHISNVYVTFSDSVGSFSDCVDCGDRGWTRGQYTGWPNIAGNTLSVPFLCCTDNVISWRRVCHLVCPSFQHKSICGTICRERPGHRARRLYRLDHRAASSF